uniref:Uncharacterized protein n=1 Tax=Coccolithus braarudii TaxID=221442 RepID=A0A7S0LRP1_9EUKA
MSFRRVSAADVDEYSLDGVILSQHDAASLRACATARSIPRELQEDERMLRVLLAALLAAAGAERASDSTRVGATVSSGILAWRDLRNEAASYLIASIKKEGCVSAQAANALNVINRPHVVESFTQRGNRWTLDPDEQDMARLPQTRGLQADTSATSTPTEKGEDKIHDRPTRAWYRSKMVLWVLIIALIFVVVHVALLLRVLVKVHNTDSTVLLYPVYGLSASALVAAFAIVVNKLSGST